MFIMAALPRFRPIFRFLTLKLCTPEHSSRLLKKTFEKLFWAPFTQTLVLISFFEIIQFGQQHLVVQDLVLNSAK